MKAKFSQNARLKDYLIKTGDNVLVEASLDLFWGAGKRMEDRNIFKTETHVGKNMCGKLLMEIRDELCKT